MNTEHPELTQLSVVVPELVVTLGGAPHRVPRAVADVAPAP
jgi:hypothetical protein